MLMSWSAPVCVAALNGCAATSNGARFISFARRRWVWQPVLVLVLLRPSQKLI
jgi:hypothetical protein